MPKKKKTAFDGQRVTKGPREKSSFNIIDRLLGRFDEES
jgi:hypothetical protein